MFNILRSLQTRFSLNPFVGDIAVALVGIGGWGYSNAITVMQSKQFRIVGVYDIDKDLSHRFAKRFGVHVFESYNEVLEDCEVVAVILSVPNQFHFEMTEQALKKRKHVFVEKPLASSSCQCEKAWNISQEQNVLLQIGHHIRKEPAIRKMKEFLDDGALGKVLFCRGLRTLRCLKKDWRVDPQICPRGSMEQLGIHILDVFLFLFGDPLHSYGWMSNECNAIGQNEWGHLDLLFQEKIHASVSSSFSASYSNFLIDVFCEKGQLQYNAGKLKKHCDGSWKKIPTKGDARIKQFEEFAFCIKAQKLPEVTAMTAASLSKVLENMETV